MGWLWYNMLVTEISRAFLSLRIKFDVRYSCIGQSRAACACARSLVCACEWVGEEALMTSHDDSDRLIMSPRYCIPLIYPPGGGMFQTNPPRLYVHVHVRACMSSHADWVMCFQYSLFIHLLKQYYSPCHWYIESVCWTICWYIGVWDIHSTMNGINRADIGDVITHFR